MLSSLVKDNLLDNQKNREKIQKVLNKIYELLTNKKSKKDEALNLLDDLIYEKINLEEIPQSLNLQGCLIMTFSKFWMIIILSSLNQMKFKDDKIKKLIELVNISFYQDLNERNEYKSFFEDLCEELISDKIAFDAINLNNHLKNKLKNKNDHLEIKKHYITLMLQYKIGIVGDMFYINCNMIKIKSIKQMKFILIALVIMVLFHMKCQPLQIITKIKEECLIMNCNIAILSQQMLYGA